MAETTSWTLRYAPHIGLVSPDEPLFRHSAGTADPVEQVRYLAGLGFAGIEDNYLKLRSVAVQEAIGRELALTGLGMGCFVNNVDIWNKPLWGSADPAARARLEKDLQASIEAATRVGGKYLTTVSGRDPAIPLGYQWANMIDNLRHFANRAEDAGLVLGLETVDAARWPGMLLHHIADAYAIVKAVDSPAVRLVFDIAHVAAMDGQVLTNLAACWDAIGVIQAAESPGRFELGSGELNWPNILRFIRDRGYTGMIELEHVNRQPGLAGERAMLDRLRAIDKDI